MLMASVPSVSWMLSVPVAWKNISDFIRHLHPSSMVSLERRHRVKRHPSTLVRLTVVQNSTLIGLLSTIESLTECMPATVFCSITRVHDEAERLSLVKSVGLLRIFHSGNKSACTWVTWTLDVIGDTVCISSF